MNWFNIIDELLKDTDETLLNGDVPRAKFVVKLMNGLYKFEPLSYATISGIKEWCISRDDKGIGVPSVHLREFLQETLPKSIEKEFNENIENMNTELKNIDVMFNRDKTKEGDERFGKNIRSPELKNRQILYDKFLDGNLTEYEEENSEYWSKFKPGENFNIQYFNCTNKYFYDKIKKIILERYNSEKYISYKKFMTSFLKNFETKKSVNKLLESIKDIQDAKIIGYN